MMRWSRWWAALLVLLSFSSAVEAKVRVAVMPTQLDDTAVRDVPKLFDDYVLAAVHKLGVYDVIGQDDINAMLSFEQQRDLVNCSETSCLANIGGALGVQKLVVLKVARVGANWVTTAKLLDLAAAQVENRTTGVVPGDVQQLLNGVPAIVAEIFGVTAPPVPVAAPAAIATPTPTPVSAPVAAHDDQQPRRGASPTIGLRVGKNFSAPEGSTNTIGVHLSAGYYFADFFSLSASTRLDKLALGARAMVYPIFPRAIVRPAFGVAAGYSSSTAPNGDVYTTLSTGVVAGVTAEPVRHLELGINYGWRYNKTRVAIAITDTTTSNTGTNHNGDVTASWRF